MPVVGNVTEHVTTGSNAGFVVVHCVNWVTAPHVRLAADSPCGRGTAADDEDGSINPAATIDDAIRAVTAIRRQRTIRPTCSDFIAERYQRKENARIELASSPLDRSAVGATPAMMARMAGRCDPYRWLGSSLHVIVQRV